MKPNNMGFLDFDNICCQDSKNYDNYVIYQQIKNFDVNTYEDILNNIYKLKWTMPKDGRRNDYNK